jgi:membrane protease YdiL (CAAX protease family)
VTEWNATSRQVSTVLAVATLAFVAYHYGAAARRFGGAPGNARAVFLQRLSGFGILGVAPLAVALVALPGDLADHGLALRSPARALAWFTATALLALPFVAASARRPASWAHYPEVREASWDRRLHLANAAAWAVYLLGYEFLFRGFLLMNLNRAFGAVPAVAITTALYVFAHLPKNAGETLGTLPIGVVFAAAALDTGSIWPPFAAHLVIAVSSDWLVTRARGEVAGDR